MVTDETRGISGRTSSRLSDVVGSRQSLSRFPRLANGTEICHTQAKLPKRRRQVPALPLSVSSLKYPRSVLTGIKTPLRPTQRARLVLRAARIISRILTLTSCNSATKGYGGSASALRAGKYTFVRGLFDAWLPGPWRTDLPRRWIGSARPAARCRAVGLLERLNPPTMSVRAQHQLNMEKRSGQF
jgi:hypothetical protein